MQYEYSDLKNKSRITHYAFVLSIALLGVLSFKVDYSEENRTTFQKVFIEAISPVQNGVVSSQNIIKRFFNNYFNLVGVNKLNSELTQKVMNLEQEIHMLSEVNRENERLRDLLSFGKEISYNKVSAQVIGWDGSGEFFSIRINKGTNDGIKKNSAVINAQGLVGIIASTSSRFADIQTVLDFNFRVDVLGQENRVNAIFQGNGQGGGKLNYVTNTSIVNIDDVILTSGMSPFYPKGIRVGLVSSVKRNDYELTQKVEVKPFVDFSRIEEVVILTSKNIVEKKDEQ